MSNKPTILIVGDAVYPSGFARVLRSIFEPLCEKYTLYQLGTNYHGDPHDYRWPVYPATPGGDIFGINRLKSLIDTLQPQLVFLLHDLWIHAKYMDVLSEYLNRLKVILYCSIDAGPIAPEMVRPLEGVHRLVVYTQFARTEIQKAAGSLFPDIQVMPLGIDTTVFYPQEKAQAKQMLYGASDSFVVLNANRNQPRKRIDITMKGFQLFAQNKPENVKLYLHMGIEDLGWNIAQLAQRYNIENRLIITMPTMHHPEIPSDRLNLIYNACDVGLNTATGEGWGLVTFEHAATAAAQIVPNHTSGAELWTGAAELLDAPLSLTNPTSLSEGRYVTPEGVAEALERLYENPRYLAEMSQAAYQNATKPEYQWANIVRRWETLFDEMLC